MKSIKKKHRNVSTGAVPPELTATVNLSVFGKPVRIQATVPTAVTRPQRMLPVFQKMAESFVGIAVEAVQAEGLEISCAKGCGACCRQMVPISEIEAYRISKLVDEMPEPRKTIITRRFEEAIERMSEAGLLATLQNSEQITNEEFRDFGLKYFFKGVACPFIEDESCSIHADRPIVCREYLVVSPAENCRRLNGEPIKVLNVPFEMSKAVRHFNTTGSRTEGWIPLILLLKWTRLHSDQSLEAPGTQIFSDLLKNLTDREIPESAS